MINDNKIFQKEKKFWGPKYGKIYPNLEFARPYKTLMQDISSLLANRHGGIWLDVGCGSGGTLEIVWNKVRPKKMYAFDLSEIMLEHTKNNIDHFQPKPYKDQINLFIHDLRYPTSFANNTFDGIVSNLVLSYVIEHRGQKSDKALEGVLKEIYRIMKIGAIFVWSTPIKNVKFWKVFVASWREIFGFKRPSLFFYGFMVLKHALRIQKLGKKGIYNFMHDDQLILIMEKIGFKDIEIKKSFAKQAWIIKAIK